LEIRQEVEVPVSLESGWDWKKLPYFLDDYFFLFSLNQSGMYWSNQFRELSYGSGFSIGFEGYMPLERIAFLNYGIHFTQRNFSHNLENAIGVRSSYLDFPIFVSYELPELRRYDFRFLLGGQTNFRLKSRIIGEYSSAVIEDPNSFNYDVNLFRSFDLGFLFGLSAEYENIYIRARSYVGVNKLMETEQGSMNSFSLDFGYFLTRRFRR
jgi:hypothetical protein